MGESKAKAGEEGFADISMAAQIMEVRQNIMDVQDAWFFWAAHRSAAQHARRQCEGMTLFGIPSALSLRTCRPALFNSVQFKRMLYRGYRVRAARRRGMSKALAGDFPERPASHEQLRALHDPSRAGKTIDHDCACAAKAHMDSCISS